MSSKQIEYLVKLRDAFAMAVDATNEFLETLAPVEVKEENLNFDKLFWEIKKGEKGDYQQTSEKSNQNSDLWKTLKAKVKEHKGFWQNSGYKFWFHQQDDTVIDRRKA